MNTKALYTFYSLSGGTCAAFGSLLGKLSGSYDSWLTTIGFFVAMICVNTFGFMLFAKSLNLAPSSLQPTLFSTASSYIASAVIGYLTYNEELTKTWWSGTFLVIMGMLILHSYKEKDD